MAITMVILIAATRLKNGAGYMALVTASTTIPVYLSNLFRSMDSGMFELSLHICVTINVICFPCMWFYIRSQLDNSFRIKPRQLLHFIPAIISLICNLWFYGALTPEQIAAERAYLQAGNENLPAIINDTLLFGQFFIYFPLMFRSVYKNRRYILENHTNSNYILMLWLPRFLWLFFILFFIVFAVYIIYPRTDVWLIPILNTIGMAYLTYSAIVHSRFYPDSSPSINSSTILPSGKNTDIAYKDEKSAIPELDRVQMQEICNKLCSYLKESRLYLQPELTLALLAKEVGIPQRAISRSINTWLKCNFFEFINQMRVEEAKRKLLELETADYNIDSIYQECGFRSRSTFFMVFKKIEGKTPAVWLKGHKTTVFES